LLEEEAAAHGRALPDINVLVRLLFVEPHEGRPLKMTVDKTGELGALTFAIEKGESPALPLDGWYVPDPSNGPLD
jgi:hypothetical protein